MSEKPRNTQPNTSHEVSVFDGGAFSLRALGQHLEIQTGKALPKSAGGNPNYTASEKADIRKAFTGELKFSGADKLRALRAEMLQNPADSEARNAFYAARAAYQEKGKKVGIRNIDVAQDGVVTVDTQMVHFPLYVLGASPEQSPEHEAMSRLAGVAMIVRTSDDRLVVQHRAIARQRLNDEPFGRGNAKYADIPGASVAGMADATLRAVGRQSGTIDAVTTDTVINSVLKEAGEELGLSPEHLDINITGIATDHIKVHDEFLLLANTDLTVEDLHEVSRNSTRNKNLGDADFEEKFIDMPANPDAVELFLTEVKCPLPPTHAAALVAAGYAMVLERHGSKAAEIWLDGVQTGVQKNYQQIDDMVQTHYMNFPESKNEVPERFWKPGSMIPPRNLYGYDPSYGPQEQGLPDFHEEMVRVGILDEDTFKQPKKAYLFDVDGPVSDPHEREVIETELFDIIVAKLEAGEPVALNSGRSVQWMEPKVIAQILERVSPEHRKYLVAIGEKGGSWMSFSETGEPVFGANSNLIVTPEIAEDVNQLIETKYADTVAILDPKATMLSLEMLPGYDLKIFSQKKHEIAADLQAIIEKHGKQDVYAVDATTIAIDIESPFVGKAVGARRFVEYLRTIGVSPESYETFGDSPSDSDMARQLAEFGKKVSFIYVGNDAAYVGDSRFPVKNIGKFSTGTLEYLVG